MYAHNVAGF